MPFSLATVTDHLVCEQNHAILFQFTELLLAITEPDQLAAMVPPVEKLIAAYHLDPAVAFDIARPKLRAALKVRSGLLSVSPAHTPSFWERGLISVFVRERTGL